MRIPRSQVAPVVPIDRGIDLGGGVRAFPIEAARNIVVITRTDPRWDIMLAPRQFNAWIADLKEDNAFVWLDPPDERSGELVDAALKQAGVPVRHKRANTPDAVISEASVESPAQVSATIREVVQDMADEAVAGWPAPDQDCLDGVLDTAMTEAGL